MPSGVYKRAPRGSGRLSRVSFFVDDLLVGDALRRLVGIAQGAPEVQPVVNAEVKANGQLAAISGGHRHEILLAYIRENKLTEFTSKDVIPILRKAGINVSNTTSVLQRLVTLGAIKRVGKGGKGKSVHYSVIGE